MRNRLARHVKTNVKNQVKQREYYELRAGDCCEHCKNKSGLGYFSDTVRCYHVHSEQPSKTGICDNFVKEMIKE